jgi:ribosome-associated toxin RatA of RatAB toxin-antitoxin module
MEVWAMKVGTKVYILGPLDRVYELAEDVMRWPKIMPHYKSVNLLDEYGNKKVLEMVAFVETANRKRLLPIKWTAIQETIPEERAISFWLIKGPLKDMEVEWTFGEMEYRDSSIVEIGADYTFNKYLLIAKYAVGNFFVNNPFSSTLSALKDIVEAETMAKQAASAPVKNKSVAGGEGYKLWSPMKDIYA